MQKTNCPFCGPKISEVVFAETDNFLAVYNIAPILPGHSLIIPRRHIQSVFELSDPELYEFIQFSRSVTHLLLGVFNTEGFNWSLQEKEIAGQTISHIHWHIVLRYKNDYPDPGSWYPKVEQNTLEILDSEYRKKLTDYEMQAIIGELRKHAVQQDLFKPG